MNVKTILVLCFENLRRSGVVVLLNAYSRRYQHRRTNITLKCFWKMFRNQNKQRRLFLFALTPLVTRMLHPTTIAAAPSCSFRHKKMMYSLAFIFTEDYFFNRHFQRAASVDYSQATNPILALLVL